MRLPRRFAPRNDKKRKALRKDMRGSGGFSKIAWGQVSTFDISFQWQMSNVET